ncbi:hypothetical protein [Pasteuria penetrans]|uniref:hypothetical protein n=1 Tax=Pasteuria penetrans TaxID=86005 RepID=UPI00165C4884|nr:hypothetical protein [Pasteuria penetrans]
MGLLTRLDVVGSEVLLDNSDGIGFLGGRRWYPETILMLREIRLIPMSHCFRKFAINSCGRFGLGIGNWNMCRWGRGLPL